MNLEGNTLEVGSIDERLEDDAEWWKLEPASKMHDEVTLKEGMELAMFRNMNTGSGYLNSGQLFTR